MKKIFTVVLTLIFLGTIANAQGNLTKQKNVQIFLNSKSQSNTLPYKYSLPNNKSSAVACIDTLLYPQGKTTGLEVDTMYFGYVEGVAEAYYLTSNGLVYGVRAFILLDTNTTSGDVADLTMLMKVSNIDALKRPIAVIDSSFIVVSDIGFQEQTFMFTTPVPVTTDFTVSIELDPATPMRGAWYVTNSSVNADGNDEQLAATLYAGIWYNFQGQFTPPWDIDYLVAPIFSQDINAGFTASLDSMCLNNLDTVVFTDTSTVNMTDTMINFNSTNSTVYLWNYDDGTGTYNHIDTSYMFTMPGQYDVQLLITNYGYTGTCMDTMMSNITVYDTAIANFGWVDMGGGLFQFNDSSLNATTWFWDFGDGNVDNVPNPSHTYATPGNYIVCLTVSDSNGCNVNTICDTISFTVGIDDYYASEYVKVYPIPANKYFNVAVPTNYFDGNVIVTDVVGQQLKSIRIDNQEKIKVSTEGIASGIYFVSIDYNGELVFTQRIVIDK